MELKSPSFDNIAAIATDEAHFTACLNGMKL